MTFNSSLSTRVATGSTRPAMLAREPERCSAPTGATIETTEKTYIMMYIS